MSDEWARAWSELTHALENAKVAGMTLEEVENCVDEVFGDHNEAYEPGPPKLSKG